MSSFTNGQVVNVRASAANKYLPAWYVRATHDGRHEAFVRDGGLMIVSDDNIQAETAQLTVSGLAYVFKRRDGQFTIMTTSDHSDEIADAYRNFNMMKLVAIIDLARFAIAFTEGEGMIPQKHQTPRSPATPWQP